MSVFSSLYPLGSSHTSPFNIPNFSMYFSLESFIATYLSIYHCPILCTYHFIMRPFSSLLGWDKPLCPLLPQNTCLYFSNSPVLCSLMCTSVHFLFFLKCLLYLIVCDLLELRSWIRFILAFLVPVIDWKMVPQRCPPLNPWNLLILPYMANGIKLSIQRWGDNPDYHGGHNPI